MFHKRYTRSRLGAGVEELLGVPASSPDSPSNACAASVRSVRQQVVVEVVGFLPSTRSLLALAWSNLLWAFMGMKQQMEDL